MKNLFKRCEWYIDSKLYKLDLWLGELSPIDHGLIVVTWIFIVYVIVALIIGGIYA